jgi:hypothetical protein
MEAVKSKLRTAVWLMPSVFLLGAIACWWGFISIGANQNHGRTFLFLAIVLTLFVAGLVYSYLSKNTAITISDEGINLDYASKTSRFINWSEVKVVDAINLSPFFGSRGSVIHINDGTSVIINPDNYSNAREICGVLQLHLPQDDNKIKIEPRTRNYPEQKKQYAGNPWTSYNSILFYLSSAFVIFLAIWSLQLALLVLLPCFYLFLGSQMYYFNISGDKLIVKNHYCIWYKKIYPLDEIQSLIYELRSKTSSGLGLVLNDFATSSFSAGSLRKKDWKQLMNDIQSMHIDFQNGQFLL